MVKIAGHDLCQPRLGRDSGWWRRQRRRRRRCHAFLRAHLFDKLFHFFSKLLVAKIAVHAQRLRRQCVVRALGWCRLPLPQCRRFLWEHLLDRLFQTSIIFVVKIAEHGLGWRWYLFSQPFRRRLRLLQRQCHEFLRAHLLSY